MDRHEHIINKDKKKEQQQLFLKSMAQLVIGKDKISPSTTMTVRAPMLK